MKRIILLIICFYVVLKSDYFFAQQKWSRNISGPAIASGTINDLEYATDNKGNIYAIHISYDASLGQKFFTVEKYNPFSFALASWNSIYQETINADNGKVEVDNKDGLIYISISVNSNIRIYKIQSENVTFITQETISSYLPSSDYEFKIGNNSNEFYFIMKSSPIGEPMLCRLSTIFEKFMIPKGSGINATRLTLQSVGDTLWMGFGGFGNKYQLFKTNKVNISFIPAENNSDGYVMDQSANFIMTDSCYLLSDKNSLVTLVGTNQFSATVEKTYNNGIASFTAKYPDFTFSEGHVTNFGSKIYLTSNFGSSPSYYGYRSTKVLVKDYNTDIWDTLGSANDEIFEINNNIVAKFSSDYNSIAKRFVAGYKKNDEGFKLSVLNTPPDVTSIVKSEDIVCVYDENPKSLYTEFSLSDENYDSLILLSVTSNNQTILSDNSINFSSINQIGNRTYFDINASYAAPGTVDLKFTVFDGYDTIEFFSPFTFTEVTVFSVVDDYVCGDVSKTISAVPSIGTINWYSSYDDITPIATSNSFVTGIITSDTVFYLEAVNGTCTSQFRDSVVITYRFKPTVVSFVSSSSCGYGNYTISASASAGSSINWYDQLTEGTFLGVGNSFTTPYLTNTTYYFAEAYDGYCGSDRQQVNVEILPVPVFTSIQSGYTCGSGAVTLSASLDSGTVTWYDSITLTTLLFTGDTFITDPLLTNTTFYVYGTNTNCATSVTPVLAEVRELPFLTKNEGSRCGTGTVDLYAEASNGTISWFDTRSGGSAIGSGSFFTTPVISATRYYYLEINDGFCTTPRDSILATINTIPTISFSTISSPSTCGATDGFIEITGAGSGTLTWNGAISGSTPANTLLPYTISGLDGGIYNFTFYDGICTSNELSTTITSPTSPSTPTVTASSSTTFCSGGSVVLTSSSSDSYLWTNGETTQSIVVTAAGSYGVTVTNASGCSSSSALTSVIVNSAPSIALGTVTNTSTCGASDGSIQINGSGSGLLSWYGAASGSISATLPYILSAISSGTYNFEFTDASGCVSNTLSQNITDPSGQIIPVITVNGSTTFCAGSSVVLTSSPSATYLWSNGETTQSIVVTTTGTYSVTATNVSGCSASSVGTTVSVNTSPSIAIGTLTNPSTCGATDGSVQIIGSGSGTISWSGTTSGTTSTTLPFTLSSLGAGTYNFSFTNGCVSNSVSQNISDPSGQSIPVITVNGSTTFCAGGSVVLTSSPSANYLWSNGEATQSITVTSGGNYSVTATNASGCSSSSVATNVTVNASPGIALGTVTNPSTCGASDGSIQITGTGTGTISWSGTASGSTSATLPYTLSSLGAGTYNFSFTNGCVSNTVSQNISDPAGQPVPTITANGAMTFCEGGSVLLTSSLANSYLWSNGETTQSILVTNSGNYTVIATNVSGCSDTSSVSSVNVAQAPLISNGASTNPSICGASDGSIQVNGSGIGIVSWSGTANGSITSVTLPYLISGLGQGNYYIRFNNGCLSDTLFAALSDPGAPATPTISASGVTTFCSGDSVTLTSSSSTGNVWSNGETTQSITVTNTGNYNVTVQSFGCSSTSSNEIITVNSSTTANDTQTACDSYTWIDGITYTSSNNTATFVLTNSQGCDSTVTLNLTINNSSVGVDTVVACDSYTWIDGVTYTSSNNTATFVLTNSQGCDSTVTLNLTINNSSVGVDTIVACDNYTWIDGITYTSSNNTATFVLTNSQGCDSTVTLNLTINNSSVGVDTIVACDNYTWIDGITYTSSNNTATFVLTNSLACDSTVTLNLTINNSSVGVDTVVACDSYTWIDGITYTSSNNTATFVLTNSQGCDSTVTLNLIINNSSVGIDTQVACGTYTWIDGNTYTSSNNSATFTITNSVGCDSIVTLNLTVNPKPIVFTNETLEVCESESLILSASSTAPIILWFENLTSENEIGEGFTFETPIINSSTTYYVEALENGCSSDRLAITIAMNGKPQINLTSTNSYCGNTDGSASASIIGGATPYTYYWSNGEQGVLDIFNLATGSYYFNVEDNNGCKSLAVTEVIPSNITFNPIVVNPSCFGSSDGSINLNVSGLSGQFSYLWNNGGSSNFINNLVAGNYEVTVTSETGCIVTSSFELVQPNQIGFEFTTVQPDCGDNNGEIQLANISGGSGIYIYNWSTGQTTSTISNLTYGIYEVSITDQNNCFETKSIMLSEKNSPIVEAVITNPECNESNGAIDLNIIPLNGHNIASISWSNGASTEDITSINKGYYTSIITTNSGCVAVNGWNINNNLPQTQEICLVTVDSVTTTNLVVWEKVQLEGISHYNIYRESNQIDDYQLIDTVRFDNLSVFNDVVASPKVRSWRYKIAAVDFCGNIGLLSTHHKTVHLNTFDLGATGTKITWDKYEGNLTFSSYVLWRYTDDTGWEMVSTIPTSVVSFTDNTLTSTPGLDYMIEVEIDEICTATIWRAQDFDVSRSNKNKGIFNPGSGVEGYSNNSLLEFESQNVTMNVYPNPFESKFIFELNGTENIEIELFDISGKFITTMICNEGINELNLVNIQDGVYFIRTSHKNEMKTIKIIKQ